LGGGFSNKVTPMVDHAPIPKGKTSVLIVLIAGIGDLVLASKSLRAMRSGFPDAEIHLLTSTDASPLAANYRFVDRVWAFPVRESRKSKLQLLPIVRMLFEIRKVEFQVAVNLYRVASWAGALRMGLLFSLLKARGKVGHASRGFGLFLDKKAPPDTFDDSHYADAMARIAVMAGGKPDQRGIEVFWDQGVEDRWSQLFSQEEMRPLLTIGINPGSDRPNRRWSLEGYARVADQLIEQSGARVLLLGGPGEETLAQEIQRLMKGEATSLTGRLTLDELIYVISRLDLLITNDSGPMHIAAALKTPIVAIFGPENPIHARPYTSQDLYRIIQKDVDCRPCTKKTCERPLCLDLITPAEVLILCQKMLEARAGQWKHKDPLSSKEDPL
jgi:lipopolysaccharide heptosyltransferase II